MTVSLHSTFLPYSDPDACLAFYQDVLGFEVLMDVGYEGMRWINLVAPGTTQPVLVLDPPVADPGVTDEERRMIEAMMAKGTYRTLLLVAEDLGATFDRIAASGAEIVQEPMDQPYGVRDCAVRDPAGNLLRIQQQQ